MTGRKAEYTCPKEYAAFQGGLIMPPSEAEARIRAMYPDKDIAKGMVAYYQQGRPKQVADEFKRVRVKKPAKERDQFNDLIAKLELIDGRYTTGQEPLLRGVPADTLRYWNDAFTTDAELMPKGVKSYLVKEMSKQLAVVFFKIGREEAQRGRMREAFKNMYEAYKLDGTNNDVTQQVSGMEKMARDSLASASDCETVNMAFDITIPESPVHKKAEALKQQMGCR